MQLKLVQLSSTATSGKIFNITLLSVWEEAEAVFQVICDPSVNEL
jgi:hypothetical protein